MPPPASPRLRARAYSQLKAPSSWTSFLRSSSNSSLEICSTSTTRASVSSQICPSSFLPTIESLHSYDFRVFWTLRLIFNDEHDLYKLIVFLFSFFLASAIAAAVFLLLLFFGCSLFILFSSSMAFRLTCKSWPNTNSLLARSDFLFYVHYLYHLGLHLAEYSEKEKKRRLPSSLRYIALVLTFSSSMFFASHLSFNTLVQGYVGALSLLLCLTQLVSLCAQFPVSHFQCFSAWKWLGDAPTQVAWLCLDVDDGVSLYSPHDGLLYTTHR